MECSLLLYCINYWSQAYVLVNPFVCFLERIVAASSMPVHVHDTDVYIIIFIYFGNEIR